MGRVPSDTIKSLYGRFDGRCMFPGCTNGGWTSEGLPNTQIAYIASNRPGGLRYDPSLSPTELVGEPNLVLLCLAHHRLVDSQPDKYTADWLRTYRFEHVKWFSKAKSFSVHRQPKTANRLQQALDIWRQGRRTSSEEFWQQFFAARPELLEATIGGPFVLRSKCYVGGKSLNDRGGNVLDFLAQRRCDVTLIEIKTPTTRLLGGRYRANVFPPSRETAGAIVQVLEYRRSLLTNLHALQGKSPELVAHSPSMVILAGDRDEELRAPEALGSFQLYRTALKDITLITFDELFERVETLAALLGPG